MSRNNEPSTHRQHDHQRDDGEAMSVFGGKAKRYARRVAEFSGTRAGAFKAWVCRWSRDGADAHLGASPLRSHASRYDLDADAWPRLRYCVVRRL